MRTAIALLLLVGLTACGGSPGDNAALNAPAASEVPFMPVPDPDPFYTSPDPLPKVPPGTILKSEPVTFAPLGVPLANPAWRLQYMSTNMHGEPVAAVAVVVKPLVPAAAGNKPLLSYHFFTDAPGLKCQPSHQVTGSRDALASQAEALEYIPAALGYGWTLVFPDHEGPTASVAVGPQAAPVVLDGIRAAVHFEPLGLPGNDTPVGMMGYSGGSVPTVWAAALQPGYAPELNIVGAAAGGTVTNPGLTLKLFDDKLNFSLAFGALISVNRLFPQGLPDGFLTGEGMRAAEALKDSCDGMPTDGSPAPPGPLARYTTADDPFASPGFREVFSQLTLPRPGQAPATEVFFYHRTADELVPIEETARTVAAWCAAGSRIHFFRDPTLPVPLNGYVHTAGGATFIPPAELYLLSRFNDSPMPVLPPGTETCN